MKNSKNSKELEIVYEFVDKLKPSNYNPRTISEKDLKALVKNMNKYGTLEILVANQRTGNIISGHQRLKAELLLGMERLPVIWVDVSKRDEKMINLAMNKISGEWDIPMLKDTLEEIDNGEGDMDIVTSDRRGPMRGCRWRENPGTGDAQKQPWRNHFIGCQDKEAMFMTLADIDDDGMQDVLVAAKSAKQSQIIILRRLDSSGDAWEEHVIPYPPPLGLAKAGVGRVFHPGGDTGRTRARRRIAAAPPPTRRTADDTAAAGGSRTVATTAPSCSRHPARGSAARATSPGCSPTRAPPWSPG